MCTLGDLELFAFDGGCRINVDVDAASSLGLVESGSGGTAHEYENVPVAISYSNFKGIPAVLAA
jgi:hypothetical protein